MLDTDVDELERLRRTNRDLAACFALPALWAGREARYIVTTLLDILVSMLDLELACAVIHDAGGQPVLEEWRARVPMPQSPIARAIEAWPADAGADAPSVKLPGIGNVRLARSRLSIQRGSGWVMIASRCSDFPTERDMVLLRATVNQAGIALNIADLVSREHELLASEQVARREAAESHTLLKRAMDAGELGAWEWDIRANKVTWTERIYEFHGVNPGTFGETVEDFARLVHAEDWPAVQRALDQALTAHAPYELEFRTIRPDGEVRWLFTRADVLTDAGGAPVRMIGITQDITERKQAEEALRAAYQDARRRQHEAEGLAAVARTINTLDLDTVLQGIADSACSLLEADVATVFRLDAESGDMILVAGGRPRGATLNRHVPRVPRGAGLVGLAVEQRGPVVSGDLLADERIVYVPEMRARIEEARHRVGLAVPLMVQGCIIGALFVGVLPGRSFSADEIRLVTTFADQAAVAMANADLYDDAQRANLAKDQFLAVLSHELRTPLTAMVGWLRMLRTRRLDPAQQERALETIERNTLAQARMVDDLLDMSRIAAGKMTLDRRAMSLAPLVAEAVEALRHEATAKGVSLEAHLDSTVGHVSADPQRIRQVLMNLLVNAVKFTPAGGRVDMSLSDGADGVRLAVRDTGAGIVPELLPHVFERFRQADWRTAGTQGGLGLGLAIVREIVELHGGTVDAQSDGPGCGAAFIVTLPVTRGATDAEPPVSA